ncbi:MAG: flagellar M-ring protein FliF [Leptospiraceae bacterium]|nr:flagellar M-ring protein FliF [Leptospiraceae bacterium]MCP5503094.1 flagellar M-ring protein FliF [Leptospiraceae bacterium]
MPEQVQKLLNQLKELSSKLDKTKKAILAAILGVVVIAFVVLSNFSLQKNYVILFHDLDSKNFAEITKKLDAMGYSYNTSDTSVISVEPEKRQQIVTKLAQENLIPPGVPGWEIFDVEKFTETQFDKDIKKFRALKGAIEKSLQTLKPINKAYVNIALPDSELFETTRSPVKASVILHYAPGIESISKKEVKGIVNLVSRAVPRLKPEYVTVADDTGRVISDFEEDLEKEKLELRLIQEKLRIQDEERVKRLLDIRKTLRWTLGGEDRVDITRFEYLVNWDKESYKSNEVSPVVKIPDNPDTPYSELELVEGNSLKVSSKETTESFTGRGFTPDGPAGTEPNLPPGYKDTDYQKANYQKKENITNYEFNRKVRDVQKQPWKVEKITLSVVVDGIWTKKITDDGFKYERKYTPVSEEEIRNITKNLKAAVGFDPARGDQLNVVTLQRDRSEQFAKEDAELERQKTIRNAIIVSLALLTAFILIILIYRAVKKEIARRRRLKEEELAAQQQMMREAALRVMEEGSAEVELSPDEKLRKELLDNAVKMAKEKPEEVAQLLRTWLSEEDSG